MTDGEVEEDEVSVFGLWGGQLVHQLLCFQHKHGAKFGSSLVPYMTIELI